jgi:hypothetical protein
LPAAEEDRTITVSEIADEFVGLLAYNTAPREVLDDPVEQPRIAQQLHRRRPLLFSQCDRFFLREKGLPDLLVAQLLQFEQHLAHVAPHDLFLDPQLRRRLLHEGHAGPRRVQFQRVHMEGHVAIGVHAHYPEIDPQQLAARVLLEAAHPVLPVAEAQQHVFAA